MSLKQIRSRLPIGWLVVVAIALCVFFVSVPASKMILGGDSPWPELDPGVAIGQRATLWADYAGFGKDNSFNRALLPIAYVDEALRSIGASPLVVNHLWLLLILIAQAVGAVRVLLLFFPHAARKPAVMGFVAAAALLNPYILLTFHMPYPALDLGIVCGPGIFASVALFVRTGRAAAACEALVWICLALPTNTNPAYIMEHVGLIGIAILLGAALGGWRIGVAASRAAVVVLGYLAANLVFWIPMAAYAASAFAHLASDGSRYTADTIKVTAAFSALWDVVRLVGGYLFFNPVGPASYIPEHAAFGRNPLVVAGTLALPLLAFVCFPLYRRRPQRRVVLWLTIAAIALLFLCKGAAPPGGEIFQWMVAHASWFAAFRDSFGKFGWVLLIVYTTLAGGSLLRLNYALRDRATVVNAICFLLIAISGFPIVMGHLFWANAAVQVPPQYGRLAAVVRHMPPDTRLLEMPIPPTIFDAYRWGYVGAGLTTNLIGPSLVSREFDFGEPENAGLTGSAGDFKDTFGQRRLLLLSGLLGIGDVIRDDNADTGFFLASPTNNIGTGVAGATRTFSSDGLDLFHLDRTIVNPRVYAADRIVVGARSLEDIALACGILAGCKGAAFAPDDIAARWPDARSRLAHIAGPGEAAMTGTSHPERGAFALPMPALVRGTPASIDRAAFADFADRSVPGASAPRTDARWFEGYPPIGIAFSGPGASFSSVYDFARFPDETVAGTDASPSSPRTLCARDGQLTTSAFKAQDPALQDSVTLLALEYDADTDGSWISVTSGAAQDGTANYYIQLPRGRTNAVLRLFRPPSDTVSFVVGVTAKGRSNCIRIDRLTLAAANDQARWSLSGSSNDMHVTPPYSASYANIVGAAANRGIRKTPGNPAPRSSDSDARNVGTGYWSSAEVLSGGGSAVVDPANGSGSAPMTLRADRAASDAHMQIEHLTPGATYRFDVSIEGWGGVPPRVVFLSQTGALLHDTTLSPSQASASLSGYVTNPVDSSKLLAYVYTGSPSERNAFVTVGPTSVTLSKNLAVASWRGGRSLPVPASLHYSQIDSSDYSVSVGGAPRAYLLVLNNAYNDAWHVTAPAGVSAEHLSANLGENAWLVRGDGRYTLKIAYAGDRFRGYATIASAICAFLAVLLYVILRMRRERPTPHDVAG